ncbi:MAG TPA: AMP-binding protein [Stellaceae bacterium]|nr:AMP-binding protein [Stellaceae bacterium]
MTAPPATVFAAFAAAARAHGDRPFLAVLPETAAAYGIAAGEIMYRQAASGIERLAAQYASAGYGGGHRVGLLLENRPAFLLHWFALNRLGASVVPINPDLRAVELQYLIGHAEIAAAVALPGRQAPLAAAAAAAGRRLAIFGPDDPPAPAPAPPPLAAPPDAATEAALLYTSGTTGRPKGCVLTNTYFLHAGRWYAEAGGLIALRPGRERMLTPLPLFHMNAMAYSAMAMVTTGGCLILLDRFHPKSWWRSVRAARASAVHYLGVMPPILLSAPASAADRDHGVRFGFGAGADRRLHAAFEIRFGFPLIEAWAMTETGAGAVIAASEEPRHIGTNCFGRARGDVAYRIERADGTEAAEDEPGELLVRHAGPDPRFGFFRAYLKDPEATAEAWAGGWFHTGDIVRRSADGSLHFVDRRKNLIRRSGENISAVEVESVLQQHPAVRQAAVAATPDPLRGDEVVACIVTDAPLPDAAQRDGRAAELVAWCLTRLAYYKAPGYVAFVESLPLTSTQKLQRGALKELVARVMASGAYADTRAMKKRTS